MVCFRCSLSGKKQPLNWHYLDCFQLIRPFCHSGPDWDVQRLILFVLFVYVLILTGYTQVCYQAGNTLVHNKCFSLATLCGICVIHFQVEELSFGCIPLSFTGYGDIVGSYSRHARSEHLFLVLFPLLLNFVKTSQLFFRFFLVCAFPKILRLLIPNLL